MVNAFINRNIFLILLYTADCLMSNVDSFDIDQISSKFVQRQYFDCNIYCKNISNLGSLDNAENGQ